LCRTRRWDAGYPDDQSKSVASEVGYNTLGSVLFTSDALGHKKTISYADSDNGARLATTTYTYNGRGLVTAVDYGVAQGFTQTWETAPGVSVSYDEAGWRATMTDGLGSVSYTYGAAGWLSSEKRTFSAFASHGPYELSYEHTLSGALRKLTDPAGDSVTYGYDSAGQLTGVTGSSFAGVTSYASNIEYRAWGGPKSIKYGDTPTAATTTYDARMRPYEYTLNVPATNATPGTSMRERFEYYADGKLKQMTDLDDRSVNFLGEPPADRRFSRRFTYDNAGRIASANGVNASGNDYYLPFRQSYTYDAFDNLTVRSGSYYYEGLTSDIAQYRNNRRQGWTYDNSGNVTHSPIPGTTSGETKARDWTYDSPTPTTSTRRSTSSTPTSPACSWHTRSRPRVRRTTCTAGTATSSAPATTAGQRASAKSSSIRRTAKSLGGTVSTRRTTSPPTSAREMFGVPALRVPNQVSVEVDILRLLFQLTVIIPITAGLLLLFADKRSLVKTAFGLLLIGSGLFVLCFVLWLEYSVAKDAGELRGRARTRSFSVS
jgi:YD repeat-containing protein